MAWLQQIRQSKNFYVCVWLPNQKRKKMISTGTSNRELAEKIADATIGRGETKRGLRIDDLKKISVQIQRYIN